tara:strand:+ start:242 stop:577 length:336 start_codon:yes stop_codon:yes gene_type:complete
MDIKQKVKDLGKMIGQNIIYHAGEKIYNDPSMFKLGVPYDKLSKDKQTYIKAFIADEPDNLFLKPGKIQFPTDERMRKHNEERSFAKGKIKTAYKIRAKVNKNYGETDLLK